MMAVVVVSTVSAVIATPAVIVSAPGESVSSSMLAQQVVVSVVVHLVPPDKEHVTSETGTNVALGVVATPATSTLGSLDTNQFLASVNVCPCTSEITIGPSA